ncbi:hypothetical protein EV360DRAFT_87010 [Lentinula raphanica]|nr:hypothetical protein EV360DRAFT_87010 [Lentinula raphanica]
MPAGHTSSVTLLALTTDGTYLASGASNSRMCIWDAKSCQWKASFMHKDIISSLSFQTNAKSATASSSAHTLYTASFDRTVKLWTLPTATLISAPLIDVFSNPAHLEHLECFIEYLRMAFDHPHRILESIHPHQLPHPTATSSQSSSPPSTGCIVHNPVRFTRPRVISSRIPKPVQTKDAVSSPEPTTQVITQNHRKGYISDSSQGSRESHAQSEEEQDDNEDEDEDVRRISVATTLSIDVVSNGSTTTSMGFRAAYRVYMDYYYESLVI